MSLNSLIRTTIFHLSLTLLMTPFAAPFYPQCASAQQQAFTAEDNHALLYAKQMQFASDGSPVVRMRIADNLNALRITPKKSFIVYPDGPGGSYIELPGNETYTLTSTTPFPGKYHYAIILARSRDAADLKNNHKFDKLDTQLETISLGSIFALKGKLFDNREHLLITSRTDDKSLALKQLETIKSQFPDDDFELYDELQAYPRLTVVLSNASGSTRVVNANLMWLNFDNTTVTVHDIPDEYGKKRDLILNSQLIVTPDASANLSLVQAASVETILRGILPAEIFASAPDAALQAQAIAARTTLISQIGARHLADPFHLCNRQHCQVYNGLNAAAPSTDRAIEQTRGQILFSGNELVKAYYSAHCGGSSATANETWALPDMPYLTAKQDTPSHQSSPTTEQQVRDLVDHSPDQSDAFCAKPPKNQKKFSSSKHAHWDITVSAGDIINALKKQGVAIHTIESIEVLSRGPSGRVTRLRIAGNQKEYIIERELPIRRFFGGLKSALFYFDIKKSGNAIQSVTFHGSGFGHGAGLCQTGAIGMAQRQYDALTILNHYYPGTHVEKLW